MQNLCRCAAMVKGHVICLWWMLEKVREEAVTNCIIHGYSNKEDGLIIIKCAYEERTVEIEIVDEGKGIPNVEDAMTALYTTSLEEERAGLGFTVMQSMMDEVEVFSQMGIGTTVKMKRSLAV